MKITGKLIKKCQKEGTGSCNDCDCTEIECLKCLLEVAEHKGE